MSEHYYRVGVHGPPDPKKHPWVQARFKGGWWRLIHVPDVPGRHWAHDEFWFPVEAPPSDLAPEPEDQGVEVDGYRYRFNRPWVERRETHRWVPVEWPLGHVASGDLSNYARVAAALGLVDQPSVPKALVEWLRDEADDVKDRIDWQTAAGAHPYTPVLATYRQVLDRIEAGEFGPVEPSVEWVTDRVPNDDEYPVLWGKDGHMRTAPRRDRDWYLAKGWRWVSLSVLLDAAGLGER